MQAIFVVDITTPTFVGQALTNTPLLLSESQSDGSLRRYFKSSPVMSTYLLALSIGNQESFSIQQPGEPCCLLQSFLAFIMLKVFCNLNFRICPEEAAFSDNDHEVPTLLCKSYMVGSPSLIWAVSFFVFPNWTRYKFCVRTLDIQLWCIPDT